MIDFQIHTARTPGRKTEFYGFPRKVNFITSFKCHSATLSLPSPFTLALSPSLVLNTKRKFTPLSLLNLYSRVQKKKNVTRLEIIRTKIIVQNHLSTSFLLIYPFIEMLIRVKDYRKKFHSDLNILLSRGTKGIPSRRCQNDGRRVIAITWRVASTRRRKGRTKKRSDRCCARRFWRRFGRGGERRVGPVPIAEEASIVGRLAVIRQANHPRACYLNGRRYAVTSQLLPLSTTR